MENINNEELTKILSAAEQKEKQDRKRTILFTIIPFILGMIFLAYSSLTVYDKANELEAKNKELAFKAKEVDSLSAYVMNLKNDIRVLEDSIQKSTDLSKYIYNVDPLILKYIASIYPRQEVILRYIFNLKDDGVKWHLGGNNPAVGFDSPNFAIHILEKLNTGFNLAQGNNNETLSDRLLKTLERTNTPEVGNVIFYPGGYVLFYFKDHADRPFVIGMTPRGIISLKPDFAKVVAVRKSGI